MDRQTEKQRQGRAAQLGAFLPGGKLADWEEETGALLGEHHSAASRV
ncbi:hypothetical protein [Sinorhizobium medicae]|nr:hypothetical protein [Sinorhizobium medicae]WQO43702.1 hypothetical protein U8C42_10335 [Sinorhizobium medicae]